MDEQTLAQRARRGDRTAFTSLYEQHAPGAWRVALVVGHDVGLAAGAVVDATVRTLGVRERSDTDRFLPVQVQILSAARAAALDADHLPAVAHELVQRLPELIVLDTRTRGDGGTVAAFEGLTELWRTVLWLREIEHLSPARIAAILGLTEANVRQLAARAQAGLHQQVVLEQVSSADAPGCQRTATRLGAYSAGHLTVRDTIRVRRHLDRCEACRGRLDHVDDLVPRLHRSIPVLPLTLQDIAEEAWQAHIRDVAGPIGLRMPNGTLAPAWAERTLAGATAAVVGLGITAAVALGARRGSDLPSTNETASGQTVGAADGESALVDELDDLDFEDGSIITVGDPTGGSGRDSGDPSSPAAPPTGAAPGETPRGGSSTPTEPSGSDSPTTPSAPPPSSPPSTDPADDPGDGDAIDDVTDVLDPPDLCTGVGPVDDLTCDAPADAPALPDLGL